MASLSPSRQTSTDVPDLKHSWTPLQTSGVSPVRTCSCFLQPANTRLKARAQPTGREITSFGTSSKRLWIVRGTNAVKIKFTVKTRIGFDTPEVFDELLAVFAKHSLDLLVVHGRTVREMYRGTVHYDCIARAVAEMPSPVLANGNVHSARNAAEVLKITGARGLMIGRGAIRNPWLFRQIRQHQRGEAVFIPRGFEVLEYVRALYAAACSPDVRESAQVAKMKKYMNFLGLGVEPDGQFLHQIRRVTTKPDFFRVCEEFLNHDQPLPLEPFSFTIQDADSTAGEPCQTVVAK